ncbi:hypothetical protein [Glutamicibacter protophormiae]|uniref:Uncharacterized protein n=1 Tax=Glutamicibacter protophormiae TaxID=37930 RepID=A0ABS4XW89_GLUPR|nr:hypothetical protein [Glutamicibacter protophormiae]MBP2399973.1 hypothetical protein [Glutamicibacter protophormiae]GGL76251.1 hypothetical protein GCM10010038_02880 [Glutamicibacter protophormiae]
MLKTAKWTMLACFAAALVLWLGFGGRSEFVASDGPYPPVVHISGWLALAGLAAATWLTVGVFGGMIRRTVARNSIRFGMKRGR